MPHIEIMKFCQDHWSLLLLVRQKLGRKINKGYFFCSLLVKNMTASPSFLHNHHPLMEQITIKTLNPKCLLYWCLVEFIDWKYNQSCWYFDPSCELAHYYLVHAPTPPTELSWIYHIYTHLQTENEAQSRKKFLLVSMNSIN
jgi:hypothetical protein